MKTSTTRLLIVLFCVLQLGIVLVDRSCGADGVARTAAGHAAEAGLESHLGSARMDMGRVFGDERFPNVVVAVDGTILASWGSRSLRVRRSEDGGKTWGKEITVASPASRASVTVFNVSVSVPIWLGLMRIAFVAPSSSPFWSLSTLVT